MSQKTASVSVLLNQSEHKVNCFCNSYQEKGSGVGWIIDYQLELK